MGEPDTDSKHYKAGWGGLVVNVLLVRIFTICICLLLVDNLVFATWNVLMFWEIARTNNNM